MFIPLTCLYLIISDRTVTCFVHVSCVAMGCSLNTYIWEEEKNKNKNVFAYFSLSDWTVKNSAVAILISTSANLNERRYFFFAETPYKNKIDG